ncbi:MAG: HDOD domain-containing protein [Tepidisphaeraceae bacterium]|jgi:putative nucleotidyltransferase with HDIG domain
MPQVAEINPAVDDFLARHQNIQALPENAVRILRMTRDSNCNIWQLLKLVEQDAALSARIMKAVNSAFYALHTKMTRLDRAVVFMGLKAVKEVTASSSLSGLCRDVTIGNHNARELWDHSVGVAILCRELAIHSRTVDPDDAFLAGMLHDVGLLLAVQSELDKSEVLFQAADAGKFSFTEVEQSVFGFNHCELGERLAQRWNFPDYVDDVIRWHHHPEEAPDEFKPFCRHVYIADSLCCEAKVGFRLTCALQEVTDQTLEMAHLSHQTIAEVTAKLPLLLRLHLD